MEDPLANLSLSPSLDDGDISLPGVDQAAGAGVARGFRAAFAPGDLLANRFRILKFVDRGGMGEVYEAEDLDLQETVALKMVLPAIARDKNALAQLKVEVNLSRKVTHRNVCRIFDLACHRPTSADEPSVWFVTMEFLKGHTLTREIQKAGKLSAQDALPLALQMASGLEAVRRAHIVHGDFKSNNVMLVPEADGPVRAVITDFGLARALEGARDTQIGSTGTPAYMAPEQVERRPLSARTDVYSFGVVMYEMVTGQWPFNADTPERIANKRLTEAPTPPVRFVPKLDAVWTRVILKCLEREPAKRYESAIAAMDEITGRSRYRKWIAGAALLLMCAVAGMAWLARREEWGPFRPTPQIAVLGWRNISGNAAFDWISTELSERLTGILQAKTSDAVVPQQDVDRAKIEFSVPNDRDLEQQDLSQFRAALGANTFVTGSYNVRNSQVTVDGVLQNSLGTALVRFHEEGTADNLAQVVAEIETAFAGKLDSKEASQSQIESSASVYPKTPQGRGLYFEALEELRSFDAASAKDKLQQVIALEKDCVGAHAALADAWERLKFGDQAASEGKIAADLAHAHNLSPELKSAADARYAELQHRWSDALTKYDELHRFLPEQLKYGLAYANALTKDGKAANSLAFLGALATNPAPVGNDPRIQVLRAEAFSAQSHYPEQLQAAQQSLTYATARREKLMQAGAQLEICWAEGKTDNWKDAFDACRAAENIFSAFDDTVNAAVALNGEANIKMEQSDYKDAHDLYLQVLKVTQASHAEVDTAGALLNLAKSEIYLGDDSLAKQHLNDSINLAHRIESHGDEARARILLGYVLSDTGDKNGAAEQYNAALKIGKDFDDPDVQAYAWSNLGELALERHDLTEAESDFRKAVDLRSTMKEQVGISRLELQLAAVQLARNEVAAARAETEKAQAAAKSDGDTADALSMLAQVELAGGQPDASLADSGRAAEIYQKLGDGDSEAKAHLMSAKAYVKKGKGAEAKAEIAGGLGIPGVTQTTKSDLNSLGQKVGLTGTTK